MKIISLWQPYATLMMLGVKRNETRHWATQHKGWLAIHAAKTQEDAKDCFEDEFIGKVLRQAGFADYMMLPYGSVLGAVFMDGCIPTDTVNPVLRAYLPKPGDMEWNFGNYQPGRFVWRTTEAVALPEPIPLRGQQGLWDYVHPAIDLIGARGDR